MIDYFSLYISNALKRRYRDQIPSIEIVNYSVKFIVSNIFPIFIILLISALIGNINEMLFALTGFISLRVVSGGYHIKDATKCFFLSILLMLLIPYISIILNPINSIVILFFCLIVVSVFAPRNIANKTRVPKKYFIIFKIASLMIVSSGFWIENEILYTSFFLQSLSLMILNEGGDDNEE